MGKRLSRLALAAAVGAALTGSAHAVTGVKISEWMYNGDEFVELTNFGPAAVNFAGWSFDDISRAPGSFSLSALGVVAPGQSVIIAEAAEATFRAAWNLSAGVRIVGGNANNLGRGDEINIYDASSNLVDRLTYDDQALGGPRTLNVSGRPSTLAVLGTNQVTQWVLSSVGDGAGTYTSTAGFIGNPGIAPVPEPETYALMLAGLGLIGWIARRRRLPTA